VVNQLLAQPIVVVEGGDGSGGGPAKYIKNVKIYWDCYA
jgi:hypothetical protein